MIKINGKTVKIDTFPNGETKIELKDFLNHYTEVYEVKWKYESDAEFLYLGFISDYITQFYKNAKKKLHILYMPYSRMDRSENGSVFTLETAMRIITEANYNDVYIYEAHSEVAKEMFFKYRREERLISWGLNRLYSVNMSHSLLQKAISKRENKSIPYVVFYPDAGAKKRYDTGNHFYLTGSKKRDFDTGRITSYEIEDAHKVKKGSPFEAIIVDDLCSYGGTFVEASKKLHELGATSVTLVVAHAEESITKGQLFNYVDKVYTTNSIIHERNGWEQRSKEGLVSYPIYIDEII